MKIAIITTSIDNSSGGVGSSIISLLKNTKPSIDYTILTSKTDSIPQELLAISNVNIKLFKTYGTGKYIIFPSVFLYLIKQRFDVYHQHGIWNFASLIGLFISIFLKKPLIITPHGMLDPWIINNKKHLKKILGFLFQKTNIKLASCLHALTLKEEKQIKNYGYTGKTLVIPNGIDFKYNKNDKQNLTLENTEKISFIYLGRIDPKKSVLNLVKAFNNLIRINNIELNIYGWGDESYITTIKNTIENKNVHLHGPVYGSSKVNAFNQSTFFILPSQSEGLPMAVLEAMSYGIPTIITDECNIDNAFIYNSAIKTNTDVKSIENSIIYSMNISVDELNTITSNAYKLLESQYSWTGISKYYNDMYSDLARENIKK